MKKINYKPLLDRPRHTANKNTWALIGTLFMLFAFYGPSLFFILGFDESSADNAAGAIALSGASLITLYSSYQMGLWFRTGRSKSTLKAFASRNKFNYLTNSSVDGLYLSHKLLADDFKIQEVVEVPFGKRFVYILHSSSIYYRSLLKHRIIGKHTAEDKEDAAIDRLTILEIPLNGLMPRIFLDSKKNDRKNRSLSASRAFTNDDYLELEGDFNTVFGVYIPKKYEIEALSLVEPRFMSVVMDQLTDFDIEIVGDRLYVYGEGLLDSKQTIQKWLESVPEILRLADSSVRTDVAKIGDLEPDLEVVKSLNQSLRRHMSGLAIKTIAFHLLMVFCLIAVSAYMTFGERLFFF